MFPFLRKKEFFNPEEKQRIVEAVQQAEQRTSGEIRVFVESRCRYVDAIDRAAEIFLGLSMQKTDQRNAVLVYVAMKDRQLAVFGDEGIHRKVGDTYWQEKVKEMIHNFNKDNYAEGIRQCVLDIGEALYTYFPYDGQTDKNELPDDIVFGR
ncbi:MAG: TPM domain-containing protein [Bacteroidota bacterium]|nr:TPM domain-containing protein [Bacteroidota bacterium]